ncbi:hypothetical protein ABZY31_23720 [Streptomyces sp. NPDC006529]|uniref:DUF7224 domain-containing protein n=1 Tax=Streptomyces sp. NPDC006529 TaxID=3157177 RepID=UPI0033A19BD1
MPTRTLLRSSSATVMAVLLAAFIGLLLNDTLTSFVTRGYGPSALGKASTVLPFAAAVCAGSAAWEAARLRRGRILDQAPVRGPVAIALPVLVPVWMMGVVGLGIALAISATAAGAVPPFSHLGMAAALGLLLAATTLAGYVLGSLLPGIAAAPIALLAGFSFTAFPASWAAAWPRQLVAGGFGSCCSIGSVIDPTAIWAAVLFAGGVCAAALTLMHRRSARHAALALVLLTAGAGGAVALAKPLGYVPVSARDASDLVCDAEARPHICLWPEVADDAAIIQQTRTYATRLTEAGLPVPATLTQNRTAAPAADTAVFGINENPTPEDVAANLAGTALPPLPACARATGTFAAYPARAPLMAWVIAIATHTPPNPGRTNPRETALVRSVLDQPRQTQLAWYEVNRQALSTCDQPPRLDIPGAAR